MKAAEERQFDVLSPYAYRQADNALKSAVTAQKNGKDTKKTLHEIAVGRAQLKNANQFAELSRVNLEAVVSARQASLAAGAPSAFPDEFKKADDHLRSITSEIENNDLSDVTANREKLQKEYLDLELKAITLASLGTVRSTIALAVKEGANEFANQSLAIAQKNADDTEAYIVANRHQTHAIALRSDAATSSANHLLKITRASKAGKNVSSEQAALRLESEQFKTQSERNTANELAAETGDLKNDQAFNQKFQAAQAEFTKEEAEVYRQGNRLVIRLRALEFPNNQSVLRGSNFPLLAKVAKVVEGFKGSSVVIEGHTDSVGGKALNARLSTERAQAVSDYLVSTKAIDRDNVTVTGYGFEKPLASNKSVKGRSQNRRVDIIISPRTLSE